MSDLEQKKEELQRLTEKLSILKTALQDAQTRAGNVTSNDVYRKLRTQKITIEQAKEMEKLIAINRDYPELIRNTEQWCNRLNLELQNSED